MIRNIILVLFFLLPMSTVVASNFSLQQQRKEFLAAEKLIKKNQEKLFFNQLEQLKDYPLYPYLKYQWLKNRLNQKVKIKNFLREHSDTRYAGRLNYSWLLYLARNKEWQEFIKHYNASKNTKLQCYYYRAKYNTGAKKEALSGAKRLWVVGKSQPDECDPIFNALQNSSYFTRDMLWQRFAATLDNKKVSLAKYVKKFMNKRDQVIAQTWLNVHAKPGLVKDTKLLNRKIPQSGLIFAHGIDRMARTNLAKAIQLWDSRYQHFKIDSATKQRIEKRLAMALAYRRDKGAYARLSKLDKVDEATKEWRVRTALREQNWQHVEQSISALNKETKEKDKWRYWLARALENTDKPKVADFIYTKLSHERSFYGYLSADKLDRQYELSDHPIQVTPIVFDRFKQKDDFRVVSELINVDKLKEAKRQWWYSVKKLKKKEILLAAKLAQQLGWKQVAIFTIAKAKYWDDVSLRFPMDFEDHVQKNAELQKLNPAVVFALIRRESAFNEKARSPVGARGLMQIMPATGKQIARELKQKWRGVKNLLTPATNVKYGSYYYKKLLNQFGGHYALAAAGYNAGPHRVKRWLPNHENMAADIWIETIPFKETRAYVSAVLTYALIYQKQLGKKLLTMKDLTKDVLTAYSGKK